MTTLDRTVTVFGAYGHTGRFVVAELIARGWTAILSGRDAAKLAALGRAFPGLEQRPASIEDAASLDRALDGAAAVINCAGPFLDTAAPVIEAALRARIHYLDVCAEQQAVIEVYERFAEAANAAGITILPAMAFYGGLADLLATAALGDWTDTESIEIAVALDSWHPTVGTRLTGERNHYRRRVVSNGALAFLADPAPTREWIFPEPFAAQDVVAVPLSEIVTLSRHVRSDEVHSYMNLAPLNDLRDPHTPAPTPIDAQGRSSQLFVMDTVVRRNGQARHASASGRDIYAITAPLVVEALQRIGDGRSRATGVVAPGEAFDAREFLEALPALNLSFREE
ncbi:saccharopine dehydrogenase family protein [Lysobacter capsici]|uniref:saccharopine dehydrogenase family protein n=1 Tax=Lysobacter capsici TaxID=435897 RepID=UPI001C000940|nr:saccharopine dehydrogenase NADP-binding domain-containing protein [Lysobacter capsici]QWF17085.1 saccharopine dehydrogenase NADP-binding domain-containing protein [Lysobacter capsici]